MRIEYSEVPFCDGLFYDDSLLRSLSSQPDLWWVTVATQASFQYLVLLQLFSGVYMFHVFLF